MSKNLPKELTKLVDWSVTLLGEVIRSELGPAGFRKIEKIRQTVKSEQGQSLKGLRKLKKELQRFSSQERFHVAHAFALMLEIVNSCEAAYRTHRLRLEFQEHSFEQKNHKYGRVIHVLTAHPTESRSADVIYYFKRIQDLLERRLGGVLPQDVEELKVYLTWAWHLPMSKQRKPSVMDEAEYIYSLALQKEVIDLYISQQQQGLPFYVRTWVGGDKDGHPGVDEKSMLGSLQMSRGFILKWIEEELLCYITDLAPLAHTADLNKNDMRFLLAESRKLKSSLSTFKNIRVGDATRVQKWFKELLRIKKVYVKALGIESLNLGKIETLAKIFPGLVVPLELREDSSLVHKALKAGPKAFAISRMLNSLNKLSPHHDPRFYVRGFILSQTESEKDIIAGVQLVRRFLGEPRLPVVPLFESAHALKEGKNILEKFFKSSQRRTWIHRYWSSKVEVMVGYSDSAKENGSWPSRFLIASAIQEIEKFISSKKIIPIFFHGSGGSIERGGGSVQEQTAWWPLSALETVKVTVQGEMIYRNYAASEILQRQMQRFAEARDGFSSKKLLSQNEKKLLGEMADSVQESYRTILQDPYFLELIEVATPYSFMKNLRFGSRPSKRQGPVDLKSLRAIPWVLCWTQTRSLFPTWWGVGSFWKNLSYSEKQQYRKLFKNSPLFSSYIKALGFTLEKIELDIFGLYLHESRLPEEIARNFYLRFQKEMALAQRLVREITGERSLLWYRPWLETSISLRSPLIHPLNILQLLALQDKDVPLLRETVTGIASGMLTTG